MTPIQVKTSELQLGDTVSSHGMDAWSTAIVVQIKDDLVHLWRPYGTTTDFSYTGGVIPYVGIETYVVEQSDERSTWTLYNRQELR